MSNTIAKIFSKKTDDQVHEEFVKFSRGVFPNRFLIQGKKQSSKWAIKTGAEFANFLVREGLERAKGEIAISGVIVTTADIAKQIPFPIERVKNFQGIKQIVLNTKVAPKDLIEIMEKFPKAFFAISFAFEGYELKILAKAPKSGKPSNKGEDDPKVNFCTLKTTDRKIVEDIFFDYPEFNEILISHTIEITGIEIPKGVSDPKEMREKAIRKGVLKRGVTVDGNKEEKKVDFSI